VAPVTSRDPQIAEPPPRAPATRRHLAGHAVREGAKIPLTVGAASRVSLSVSFPPGREPPDQTVLERLVLDVPDRGTAELSACRFVAEPAQEGWAGRLVFLQDVYDFDGLFRDGSVTNLRAFFANVGLVLEQKEGIRREFKDFVADAVYDFSVQKRFFDEQDRILSAEPPHVAQAAREAILASEGPKFFEFLDAHIRGLDAATRAFSREDYERHGFYFRRMVWSYILGTAFMKRTNLKPRGYAGDAEMMQMIYENRYEGRFLFNQLLHKHPLVQPIAQAVRNRRRMIPQVAREMVARFPKAGPHGVRLLSVACGPAWELRDLLLTSEDVTRYHVALLDQDTEALALAGEGIRRVEEARGARVSVEEIVESVRTMLRIRDLAGRFGRFHFVYSMGLFDYLTTPVARAVLARLWELVLPGGTLLVGNYNTRCGAGKTYLDYWCDWSLFYRSEEDFRRLAEGLEGAKVGLSYEETGSQMFLRLERGS
jgi:extracellular factor (EF) 3-hydroxypalmitic acid methyl ester biosynthesis protein